MLDILLFPDTGERSPPPTLCVKFFSYTLFESSFVFSLYLFGKQVLFASSEYKVLNTMSPEKDFQLPIEADEAAKGAEPPREEEETTSFLLFRLPLFQWKSFLLFLGIATGLMLHWFATSELFEVPQDILQSRHQFVKAKENYFANQAYWDAKLSHFTDYIAKELQEQDEHTLIQQLQEIPGEIFISFLLQKLHLTDLRLEQTSIFFREGSGFTINLSKYEKGIWPLKIMLSMEIEVRCTGHRFSLAISRLRRGSQDIALGLSWAYFGPELEALRSLKANSKQFILLTTKISNDTGQCRRPLP